MAHAHRNRLVVMIFAAGDVVKVGRERVVTKKKQDLSVGLLKWRVRKKRTMAGPRVGSSCYGMVRRSDQSAHAFTYAPLSRD